MTFGRLSSSGPAQAGWVSRGDSVCSGLVSPPRFGRSWGGTTSSLAQDPLRTPWRLPRRDGVTEMGWLSHIKPVHQLCTQPLTSSPLWALPPPIPPHRGAW